MAAVQEGDTASLLRELRALILSQQQSIQELSDRVLNIESLSESVEEKLSDVQETRHGASGSIVQRRASSTGQIIGSLNERWSSSNGVVASTRRRVRTICCRRCTTL